MPNPLQDEQDIRRIFDVYSFAMDDHDFRAVAELFTSDGEWITNYARAKGPDDIEATLRRVNPPRTGGGLDRKHFVTNSLIDCGEDKATARTNYLVCVPAELGPLPIIAGTYVDELVKTDDGWRLKSRTLQHDIAGSDLHLTVK